MAYFVCTLNILLVPPNAPLDADFSKWYQGNCTRAMTKYYGSALIMY